MDSKAVSLTRTAPAEEQLSLRVVSEDLEFASMSDEWEQLCQQTPDCDFFVSWQWLQCWWNVYGQDMDLRIYTVRDGEGRLLGILPTYLKRSQALRLLSFYELRFIGTGHGPEAGYFDLIARPKDRARVTGAVIPSLLSETARWDMFNLTSMPAESPLTRRLPRETHSHIFEGEREQRPIVELPPDFSYYLDTLESEGRDRIRFARERFSFDAELSCKIYVGSSDVVDLVDTLLALPGKKVPVEDRQFLSRLVRKLSRDGQVKMFVATRLEEPVAVLMTIAWHDTVYCARFASRPDHNSDELFLILASNAIEDAIRQGAVRCDFLGSPTDLIREIAPQTRETLSLGAYRDEKAEKVVGWVRRFGGR